MAISFVVLVESRQWMSNVKVHNWQKAMLGHLAPPYDTKKAALGVANILAPEECWLKSKRCSKPHDGMIDAFLIARYIRKGHALVGYDKL